MSNYRDRKEEIQKAVGSKIQAIRLEKGISQRELAARCNFEYSNMSRIESGGTNITIVNLFKIAGALEVKIEELVKSVQ